MSREQPIQFAAAAARVLLAALSLSCLVSLMISFMGGVRADFGLLVSAQRFGIVFAVAVAAVSLAYFVRLGDAWRAVWQHIPGWLVFAVLVLNSLVFIGELSYALLLPSEVPFADWRNHSSLICLLACSIAYALVSASAHSLAGHPPYSKERW